MEVMSNSNAVHQLVNDGLELSKRLIYRTAMEQLQCIFAVHGASTKEDLLIKTLAEAFAESQSKCLEYGYCGMK